MSETIAQAPATSFYDRPNVRRERIPVGPGIPLGIETVANPQIGIAGAYGTWGLACDNLLLPEVLGQRLGRPLSENERLSLAELGFLSRHYLPQLSDEEDLEVELQVGKRLLQAAAHANGWEPAEVDALVLGMTAPISRDYTERIARAAGMRASALKVSVHKACDGSVGGLNLILNPRLPFAGRLGRNLAQELLGKKVLVGGLEGLSRFMKEARDLQALQLFGNGAGIFGVVPGRTMKFLVGGAHEVYDAEGLLQARMTYPYSGRATAGESLIEATEDGENHLRFAGKMHEPADPATPVVMAGLMGMVKLFVRTGVSTVRTVYHSYQERMVELGMPDKEIAVAIVHHANLKINQLKDKTLQREGISLPMPWLVNDFGNVSAASNMIAFLRTLPSLRPGDHVLFDGFGAGTYYDVLAVELGQGF